MNWTEAVEEGQGVEHECDKLVKENEARVRENLGVVRVYPDMFNEEWYIGNYQFYLRIDHCPYCGEELK